MWQLITILPYFLVANVTFDNSPPAWSNLQLDYQVMTNLTIANATKEDDIDCRLVIGYMQCQPKEYGMLNCNFGYGAVRPERKCDGRISNSVYPEFDLYRRYTPFQLKFNEQGIENLIVPRKTTSRKLDLMKSVVRQFDINVNLKMVRWEDGQMIETNMADKKHGTATNMENTEHGNCEYEVNIIRSTLSKHSTNGKSFQLVLASSNDASPTQILEELHVQKVTRINSCSPSADIYGYQILSEKSNVEANLKTTASVRDIKIWENGFMSSTTREAVISTPTSRIMPVKQTTSIRLIGIDFASHTGIPQVIDPIVISIKPSSS